MQSRKEGFFMGRKHKNTYETRLRIISEYLNGEKSITQLSSEYHIYPIDLKFMIHQYEKNGIETILHKPKNRSYSKELKEEVVNRYKKGEGSLRDLCIEYNIPSNQTLRKWVKKYNNHIELKDYDPKGDVYMAGRRKTSFEERIEIVEYCLKHNREYKKAAETYQVSYSQIYQWVKKYELEGQDGLLDRRGKQKSQENLSEVEKLRKKIDQLEKQLELKDNENTLLKKVKEFERRRYSVNLDKKRNT